MGIDATMEVLDSAKAASMATHGWQNGIFVTGVGVSGTYAKDIQTDGPSPTKAKSALVTPEYTALLAKAAAAQDKESEAKLNQQLVQLVYDEGVVIPWAIESRNRFYQKNVHIDLDTITLQFWNPGDAWIGK